MKRSLDLSRSVSVRQVTVLTGSSSARGGNSQA
jgi:hypothetical protein